METTRYNKDWTLFLDRDGVINEEIQGSYVTQWSEFKFYEGSLNALALLSKVFGNIFVVTNQRGVGRGIMELDDLRSIHDNMQQCVSGSGGRIDRIYACTAVNDDDQNRKPNVGMALQAKEDFGDTDFQKSVMVGNNFSDMIFGKRLAMRTVFISSTQAPVDLPEDIIDEHFPSLKDWADSLSLAELSVMN